MSERRPPVNLTHLDFKSSASHHAQVIGVSLGLSAQAWRVCNLLSPEEVTVLAAHARDNCVQPVGLDGIAPNYAPGDDIGSWRASAFSDALADVIWARLGGLPWKKSFSEEDCSDREGHEHWVADGVNPLFRFIRYQPGHNKLVAHYDGPFVQSTARRSLYTLLLYLTDHPLEGETRFVRDEQRSLPFTQRSFADWRRCALDQEVEHVIYPVAGDALVFEHRLLHDATSLKASEKLVMRSDIFFSRGSGV